MNELPTDTERTGPQSGADEAPQKKQPEELLAESANAFLLKLDALLETVNRIMFIIMKSSKRAQTELGDYTKLLSKPRHTGTLLLPSGSEEYREYLRLRKARDKPLEAQRIVPQSFVVSMVSQYDAFLAAAIKNLFLLKPEKIRTAEKTISVKDLVKFTSIEDVLGQLIEDEVDEVLRGSHLSQIQWVAKKFDFTLDCKDPLIEKLNRGYRAKKFIRTCRRNCFETI